MNFEFMTIGTPLPPCMPFPRALTGFPVSSTAKVMYCRMLDADQIKNIASACADKLFQKLDSCGKSGLFSS